MYPQKNLNTLAYLEKLNKLALLQTAQIGQAN